MPLKTMALRTARLLPLLALAALTGASRAQTPELKVNPETGETQEQFAERTAWWREAKFGMFIHWGIYSVPADSTKGAAEWYMFNHQVPVADYEPFAKRFDPVKFDAHKWVTAARMAGMKYITITAKHHDGFCMFDTKLTNYNIVKATPWHHDPMKDLARECRKQGIKLCLYYSVMDWHHPDYLPRRPWDARPTEGASLDRYVQYMEGQLRELLTNYGPIGGIWFDGGWEHTASEEHAEEVVKLIRSLQPGILINNRINLPEDYDTPEQTIPANALPNGRLWETCMTLNNTWGYARDDHDWKPGPDLIHKLCDIAAKGGNFLLNVGPTDQGEFTPETVDRLKQIGGWMRVNGQAIYDTTKSPFKKLPAGLRCTQKGNALYVMAFQWPENGLHLPGLVTAPAGGTTLDEKQKVTITAAGNGYEITKPLQLDPVATVIRLNFDRPPVINYQPDVTTPSQDGSITLAASDADITGDTAQIETKADGVANVGYWTRQSDSLSWTLGGASPGRYAVELNYSCPDDYAGSTFLVQVISPGRDVAADRTVTGDVKSTGDWGQFKTVTLPGMLTLGPGRYMLRIVPQTMPHGAVMNLRSITLRPL